ncbi:MAG: hypothetical protein K2J99_10680 [Lachnospiraceae bacterium]|nr:hypothetical protein [Lachnospiraceae bacterium]
MSLMDRVLETRTDREKLWLRIFYAIVVFFCCCLTLEPLELEPLTEHSTQIVSMICDVSARIAGMLCGVLSVVSAVRSHAVTGRINEVFDQPWKKMLQILLELYGTFAMVGMYFLPCSVAAESRYPAWLYFGLAFIWMHPVMKCLLAFLIKMGDTILVTKHRAGFKTRLILIGIVLIPCMISLIAFNPAVTAPDSVVCLSNAHRLWQPDFSVKDWHPPFYMFVLRLLINICDSITFLIIVQCVCFALVFVDGILFLYQCGFSKKALGIFYLFIAFGASNIIQLITLLKDTPYMISLMWLTLLLMKRNMLSAQYADKISWYLQFVIAVIFTALFRQNGMVAAVMVIILLPVVTKFSKKVVIASVLCVLLLVTVKGPLYQSMNVMPAPELKFLALTNDILYPYYMGDSLSKEELELISKIVENDSDESYDHPEWDPYWVYGAPLPSGYDSIPSFIKLYIKNFLKHPQMVVEAVLTRNSVIWSIMKPIDEQAIVFQLGNIREVADPDISPDLIPIRKENGLTNKLTIIFYYSMLPFSFPFYWRTGVYNLLIVCMVVIIVCAKSGKKAWTLMPFVPILANLATLFISSGWTCYRYFWPSMTISLFLLFYFWFNWKRLKLDKDTP